MLLLLPLSAVLLPTTAPKLTGPPDFRKTENDLLPFFSVFHFVTWPPNKRPVLLKKKKEKKRLVFSYVSWWVSCFWFVFLPNSGKPTVESGEGNGNPLQDLCLKNPTARGVLAGYSPWGCKQSDMIEQLALQFSRSAVSDSAIPWTAAC